MNDATILAIVGSAQAIILGYLELIRRGVKKCGSMECIENLNRVLDHRAALRSLADELERTGGAPAVKQGD